MKVEKAVNDLIELLVDYDEDVPSEGVSGRSTPTLSWRSLSFVRGGHTAA